MRYIDDNGVAVLLGAIIRQAAADYAKGWKVTGDQLDPAPFLEAANMLHLVPRIVDATVYRSGALVNGHKAKNVDKPLGRRWGDPR